MAACACVSSGPTPLVPSLDCFAAARRALRAPPARARRASEPAETAPRSSPRNRPRGWCRRAGSADEPSGPRIAPSRCARATTKRSTTARFAFSQGCGEVFRRMPTFAKKKNSTKQRASRAANAARWGTAAGLPRVEGAPDADVHGYLRHTFTRAPFEIVHRSGSHCRCGLIIQCDESAACDTMNAAYMVHAGV